MTVTFLSLLTRLSKAEILAKGLEVATTLGLSVSSWAAGDPTRSLYHYLAEILEVFEDTIQPYVAAAALDSAEGEWLKIVGKQVYNVDYIEATYATTSIVLTNTAGGLYEIGPNELTFKNSVTGSTYHNITGGTLSPGPGTTLTLDISADEPGSDSNALANEITEIVAGPLGVECANPTAATGLDEEDPEAFRSRCRAKLDSLSAAGPRGAYEYVARTPSFTGITSVTRARSVGDSSNGHVTTYVASPSGAVAGPDLVAVQDALVRWVAPLTITPIVLSANGVTVPISYQLWVYDSVNRTSAEIQEAVADALADMFSERPINGDVIPPDLTGHLYRSLILATIQNVYPDHTFRVNVNAPLADIPLAIGDVPLLGVVAPTITFVSA